MPNEVVLITGTRKGIGKYLVDHFLQKGAFVEGCSRGKFDGAHPNYNHHCLDVSDEWAVKAMISSIRARHGRLDVLINNAGVASMNHMMLTPVASVDRIMSTNFTGTFVVCREAAKLMQRNHYGRIVNISTIAVPMRLEGEAIYAASKSAMTTFTQVMAREVSGFGITCNVVGATPIETDLIRGVPKKKIDFIVGQLAVKRLGRFEDVANVIDFFIRPESDYVTGQVVYLGGVNGS